MTALCVTSRSRAHPSAADRIDVGSNIAGAAGVAAALAVSPVDEKGAKRRKYIGASGEVTSEC